MLENSSNHSLESVQGQADDSLLYGRCKELRSLRAATPQIILEPRTIALFLMENAVRIISSGSKSSPLYSGTLCLCCFSLEKKQNKK